MKTCLFILFVIILVLSSNQAAFASCATPTPIISEIQAFHESEAVFVGKVLETKYLHSDPRDDSGYDTVIFDDVYVLKGQISDGVRIASLPTSVQYEDFEVGQSYLVYAFGPNLDVSICTSPIVMPLAIPTLMLLTIIQYYFVIFPVVIGGIVLFIVIRRKK